MVEKILLKRNVQQSTLKRHCSRSRSQGQLNIPLYPIVPQLNLRLATLNRSLFPSAEPTTLCYDPFFLLAPPLPSSSSPHAKQSPERKHTQNGYHVLANHFPNKLFNTRPAIEVLPRSRILGRAHFPRPALKTKMIRFWVRDVLY